jgi:phosphohistidine swiveling domain-containing protein
VELTDPTDTTCEPTRYWSRSNLAEATPDVLSPMCWSFWGPTMEAGGRLAYFDFGVLGKDQVAVPVGADNLMTAHFRGRPALNLDLLRTWFDAFPGMTADDFERDICGDVREGLPPEPRSGRTGRILRKVPVALATTHRRLHRLAAEQADWWTAQVLDGGGAADPLGLLQDSARRFRDAFRVHVGARFLLMAVQAQLTSLAEAAGRPELVMQVLAGVGGVAETSVADDLWQVGRGLLPIEQFVRRHGFHGTNEGNLDATVWREDPSELQALAVALAARPDDERPRNRETAAIARRRAAVRELTAALPVAKRPLARLLSRMAVRCVQDNEVGKACYLRAIDGGRCASLLLGHQLVADGILEQAEDARYLTLGELAGGVTREHRALVAHRRACRERHRAVDLPTTFTGPPVPVDGSGAAGATGDVVEGVAGAPGVVEGTARLVTDPTTSAPLEPGEILVCRTTDPSWAPMFTLADALVIDIGASASHGAIVARELGVPCVIGTIDGTRRIQDGDRVRVDGTNGRVEVLQRVGAR